MEKKKLKLHSKDVFSRQDAKNSKDIDGFCLFFLCFSLRLCVFLSGHSSQSDA